MSGSRRMTRFPLISSSWMLAFSFPTKVSSMSTSHFRSIPIWISTPRLFSSLRWQGASHIRIGPIFMMLQRLLLMGDSGCWATSNCSVSARSTFVKRSCFIACGSLSWSFGSTLFFTIFSVALFRCGHNFVRMTCAHSSLSVCAISSRGNMSSGDFSCKSSASCSSSLLSKSLSSVGTLSWRSAGSIPWKRGLVLGSPSWAAQARGS